MQSHLECRLWNEIFVDAQKALGIPNGELRAAGVGWVLLKAAADVCRAAAETRSACVHPCLMHCWQRCELPAGREQAHVPVLKGTV